MESLIDRFIDLYNNERLHQGIGYVTPAERHDGRHTAIIGTRRRGMQEARLRRRMEAYRPEMAQAPKNGLWEPRRAPISTYERPGSGGSQGTRRVGGEPMPEEILRRFPVKGSGAVQPQRRLRGIRTRARFVIDPARVRRAQDKARVERVVPYVRESFFRGEDFLGLIDAQRRGETWCTIDAGLRIHGTTQRRPAQVFRAEELPTLAPPPQSAYDLPLWCEPKVHRDHHIEVARALYSVPGDLIGRHVKARADAQLVKVFYQGKVVKVHPRKEPGGRSTRVADLPAGKRAYALLPVDHVKQSATSYGANVGTYATRLLDIDLPWSRMRMVYRLLGLVRRFSAEHVDEACAKALELDVVDVNLIARMLERALESQPADSPAASVPVIPLRFARAAEDFRPGHDGNAP